MYRTKVARFVTLFNLLGIKQGFRGMSAERTGCRYSNIQNFVGSHNLEKEHLLSRSFSFSSFSTGQERRVTRDREGLLEHICRCPLTLVHTQ